MTQAQTPVGIDRGRHQDLSGRNRHVWWRRAALAVIAAVPVLGLLNVFGQRASIDSSPGPAASLLVNSPAQLRGGLVFTTEIVITAHERLHDARLYLDSGWFEGMTTNGIVPQPSAQSAQGRWQVWDFGQIPAGTAYRIWISWQVNPTHLGRHSQSLVLYNGGTRLVTINRAALVFP